MNGNTYTATVINNATTVTIPAAGLQGLTNGQSYTMIANVSDAAENPATPVTSSPFAVDTTIPSAPGMLAITTPNNNNTPTITGTGVTGDTITLFEGSANIGTATVANSAWSITPSTLNDGTYTITAKAGDPAGNVSAASTAQTIVIDTIAPSAPFISVFTTPINNNTLTFTGTGVPGDRITLFKGSITIGQDTVNGSGEWYITSFDMGGDGTYVITAKQTDLAGNVSVASTPQTLVIQTALPVAPGISSIPISRNDNTPTITGTSVNGNIITLFEGSTSIGTSTVAGGTWSITTPALNNGTYVITANATDIFGQVSGLSPSQILVINIVIPIPPIILTNITPISTDTTPTITGTGFIGDTITLFAGSNSIGTATVNGSGEWSIISSTLSDGTYVITAKATNQFGNDSLASMPEIITIDTGTVSFPGVIGPTITLFEESNSIVRVDTSDYTYTIEKLVDLAVTWSYSIDGGKTWSVEYGLDGLDLNKSFVLPAGTYQYGSIIIRNRPLDNVWDSTDLYMNKTNDIIKRPGIPSVRFQHKNGIAVYKLGEGSVKWRYSLNSGETWSEYLDKPLVVYPPTGNYIPGSIYIISYSEDGTSHRDPETNYEFYTAGIHLAGTHGEIKEEIIGTVVSLDNTNEEQQYYYEVRKINFITSWPRYMNATLSVDIMRTDYTSWEYSIGLNENGIRVWIKGNTTPADIPPGYYRIYTIALRLKKKIPETGKEYSITVFNETGIVLYPKQPKVTYIEKGIFVISLLDKNSKWEYKLKDDVNWVKGPGSILLLKPGTYKIVDILIRSIVNEEVMSRPRYNLVPVVVRDNDYDYYSINEMPDKTWETSTVLTTPAYKNDMGINVYSNYMFEVKKAIIIGYGAESEIRIVTGFGSIFIDRPLTKNYPEGTIIRGFDIELIDSLSLADRAYGMFFTSNLRLGFRKRLKCLKYIYDPENATIETCNVNNETKHLLGEGQLTKKKKIKDIVRFNKGKIVYGENGLSSPFLPPDTLEETPVSIFYRCNVPNDVPIINGLRGGIVPLAMRTNKF